MTSTDQERWRRVKDQLRTELGEDVFSSWFGRMELDAVEKGLVRLSVPTRFLRNWIQSHYSEKVLLKWQSEEPDVTRLELSVRSSTIRLPAAKPKTLEPPLSARDGREAPLEGLNARASIPVPEPGAPITNTGLRTLRPLTTRMCGRDSAGRR